MTQVYALVIEIDDASLGVLSAAGAQLVVAKPAGNAAPSVAWLAWQPQPRNRLVFSETYGIYAAEIPARTGAPIEIRASVYPAADRTIYRFDGESFATEAVPRLPARHYDVHNAAPFAAAAGLLQEATINGRAARGPLTAAILAPDVTADFTAVSKLYLWTRPHVNGGSIAPDVPNDAKIIVFDPDHSERSYRFDRTTGTFEPRTEERGGLDAVLRGRKPLVPLISRGVPRLNPI